MLSGCSSSGQEGIASAHHQLVLQHSPSLAHRALKATEKAFKPTHHRPTTTPQHCLDACCRAEAVARDELNPDTRKDSARSSACKTAALTLPLKGFLQEKSL